jgi:hypothetical protein
VRTRIGYDADDSYGKCVICGGEDPVLQTNQPLDSPSEVGRFLLTGIGYGRNSKAEWHIHPRCARQIVAIVYWKLE